MSIMQHSTPEKWMVALVGLTHMVPSTVDNWGAADYGI
jgi:hypothetical protein